MSGPTGLAAGFLTQVRHHPDAPALIWHGEPTSYRALYEAAGRERERLAVLGIAPGDPVGVLARTSPAAIALVLACLLSKRPFLLPSPAFAGTRLADLFAQAGCARVLTPAAPAGSGKAAPAGSGRAARAPGQRRRRILPSATAAAQPRPDGEAAAFMLTTSGATLAPTIVPLRQAAVDRFTDWATGAFGIGPGTTVLSHAPLDSGRCLLDIWTTLAAGGCAVLADPDLATDGHHLLDLVTRHGVHVVHGLPALHGLLADTARRTGTTLPTVRHAMFTGAALSDRTFAELPHLFPYARLHNLYGCTETGDSFVHEVDTRTTVFPPVPIGRPLPGVAALVVGANGMPVDGPGRGELYVCTPFQSPGYLDRGRHRGTFTPHPLHTDDGRTWFRTGDLVRRDADGLLHLTGRAERPARSPGTRRITGQPRPARATRHVERAALDRRNALIPAQGRTS